MVITENSYAYSGYTRRTTVSGNRNGVTFNGRTTVNGVQQDFSSGISAAAEKTCEENDSKVLGLTMIPGEGDISYGMAAQYASDSTEADPIIQVTSNYKGRRVSYKVHINEVNPENASALEMFALCSYTDDKGITNRGTFGSWQKLKVCADNAETNGYFGEISSYRGFFQTSYNWAKMVGTISAEYREAGIYDQYQSGKALLTMFGMFTKNGAMTSGELIEKASAGEMSSEELMKFLKEHREEILEKLKNGDTQPEIQIGAMTLTQEEWEELLESFDEAEEAIQEQVKAEQGETLPEKPADSTINGNRVLAPEEGDFALKSLETLVTESVTCTYPAENGLEEDAMYIICYSAEGISCKKAGEAEDVWNIPFDKEGQYERVREFLHRFDREENLRFASSKSFWEDFLSGKLDVEEFMESYRRAKNGEQDNKIQKGEK